MSVTLTRAPQVSRARCESSWPARSRWSRTQVSTQHRSAARWIYIGREAEIADRGRRAKQRQEGKVEAGDGADQAVRDAAVAQRDPRVHAAQRAGPRLRLRRRRPPHRRPQAPRLPQAQPFRPDPGAAGRRRSCLRVARHQPVHRDQVRVGAAADAVGQAGGVAGGGVAPLLPAGAHPGVRAAHQAHAGRPHRRGRGGQEHRRAGQAARRLRGPPRRREQVPGRRRLHARRRQPHVLPLHAHQEPQGGPGGLPPARQGVVGRDLRPPRLEEDRRLHPPPARRLRLPVLACLLSCGENGIKSRRNKQLFIREEASNSWCCCC